MVAEASTSLAELLAIAAEGGHAASDYLEDAVLAGVRTVGCRRVGGGFAGAPAESNVVAGAALAVSLGPDVLVFEGSGACIPPVEVDRTVCVIGAGPAEPFAEYRVERAELVLAPEGAAAPAGALPFRLEPEPAEPLPDAARVAVFTTGGPPPSAVEAVVASTNLARRGALSATSSALAPSAATSISSSSRRPRSTPSPRRRRRRTLGSCSSATARWVSMRPCSNSAAMPPETIVIHKGHGLPYSKGLMAQSLSASGLGPERSFELAREIERRLALRGDREIGIDGLDELCLEVLRAGEGESAVRRYLGWRRLDRLDRPLVVLIGGTTGVGKSTLATMLAGRLGITRVIATDVIRQVLRAFFTEEAMPTVHYSAFDAGGLEGYADQAERVATGVAAIVERAANEAKPVIVEGVHVLPGRVPAGLRASCVLVEALVVVRDDELHRGHFSHRPGRRPAERYLAAFDEIRALQAHLAGAPRTPACR